MVIVAIIFAGLGFLTVGAAMYMFKTDAKLGMWDAITIGCPVGMLATAAFAFYCAVQVATNSKIF
jgi:hypothetical protein